MSIENSRNIVLGITGGIAAYKTAELIRILTKRRCNIRVVMTENACEFIGPETLKALSGHQVITAMFDTAARDQGIGHISLADWATAAIVAPATANLIGKYAHGIADDFLTTFLLAFQGPVLLAPAMNPRMFTHPAVQSNLGILMQRSVRIAGPDSGEVACGHSGPGRMTDPEVISDIACAMISHNGDLTGKRILITAGPTREPIDPVRYISNRSSGKMGFALAAAAAERGASVHLISGPVSLRPHAAVNFKMVLTAEQMHDAVMSALPQSDIVIMAAAVSDWRPENALKDKWKKGTTGSVSLKLVQNPDILREVSAMSAGRGVVIGFAAETANLLSEGQRKLREKNLDAVVVNDVSRPEIGFDSDENAGFVLDRDGNRTDIPVTGKREMAEKILDICIQLRRRKESITPSGSGTSGV